MTIENPELGDIGLNWALNIILLGELQSNLINKELDINLSNGLNRELVRTVCREIYLELDDEIYNEIS